MWKIRISKLLEFCQILKIKKILRDRNYDFPSVLIWLNRYIARHYTYSLTLDGTNTWVVLKTNVTLKYLNELNSVSKIIAETGRYENEEIEKIIENLNEASVFFDIGANVGIYSISVAKKFSDIHIFAFEPVPETVEILKENIVRNNVASKISIFDEAVSNTDGFINLTLDFHSSNYVTNNNSYYNKKSVKTVTIDKFVEENKIENIDLMKIDVEGHEYNVLEGSIRALDTFKPIILIELIERNDQIFADRVNHDYNDSIRILLDLGYKYYIFDDQSKLIHMDCKNEGRFEKPYHNYLFYFNKIKNSNNKNSKI